MSNLRRGLGAIGFGVCFLPAWLGVLCLFLGGAGFFWFLCTWEFVAFLGAVAGWMVLPLLETPF